jgi:hypothetical protein
VAPWIVMALVVGAAGRRPRTGATRAAVCLVAAVLAKYAVQLAQDEITALPAAVLLAEGLALRLGMLHGESAQLRFHHQRPAVSAELCAAALLAAWVARRRPA